MRTIPLSEVKARLSEIADDVNETHERVCVTRNGRDFVVLMSKEDLDSLDQPWNCCRTRRLSRSWRRPSETSPLARV